MYCKNCGKEINDNAAICIHCGCATDNFSQAKKTPTTGESKTGMGVVLGLFLGIIGLIIGIAIYPSGSYERQTFIKAWGITFAIGVVLSIILSVSYASCVGSYLYELL